MDNRTAITLALQKAMAYIQDHEDTRNYSKQTAGKVLYTDLLALVAMLASGAASTDEHEAIEAQGKDTPTAQTLDDIKDMEDHMRYWGSDTRLHKTFKRLKLLLGVTE